MPKSEKIAVKEQKAKSTAKDHWAFQGPQPPDLPEVANGEWPRGEIDRFVLARLEEEGLTPVGDADRRTLIRRAYFDLWGLPPSPEEVEAFRQDDSPAAYANLIDRLLDSPRFGERWGRHWLDVARYGESTGHERNFLYPHAWRYRDYVIAAFNKNKPYDRFLLEQIAGDQLAIQDEAERAEASHRDRFPGHRSEKSDRRHDAVRIGWGGRSGQCDHAGDFGIDRGLCPLS